MDLLIQKLIKHYQYYDNPNIVGINNVRQSACIIT